MTRRNLSMTPGAIKARERRFNAMIVREEMRIYGEVKAFMDRGLSFDEAWIAAGGTIIPIASKTKVIMS